MKKNILISLGMVIGLLGIYYAGIEYFLWKWEGAHTPLPSGIYETQEQKTFHPEYEVLSQNINDEMVTLTKSLQTTSISGAISVDGKLVWAGAIGLADVENQKKATLNSQYRVGSVSKALTSLGLARMVELGQISLDDDIHKYLPNYPPYENPITVRQLASHMAGIRHYKFDITEYPPTDFFSTIHYEDVMDSLEPFKNDDLLFTPGQGFNYSSNGYNLLSAVMQAASGKPFLELMQELVFDPIKMENTAAEASYMDTSNIVNFYNIEEGKYGNTYPVDLSNKWAGGGFVSTPSDLVAFGASILDNRLIAPETRKLFFTPQPMFDGTENPQAYALGWRHHKTINILGEETPVDVVHHGGTGAGSAAFLLLVPDSNISVAFISNGRGNNVRGELQMLAYKAAKLAIEK